MHVADPRPKSPLPPGQRERPWRRFGKPQYAGRRFTVTDDVTVTGAVDEPLLTTWEVLLRDLPTVLRTTDLHCVMTWSAREITWEAVRFADLHARLTSLVGPHDARSLIAALEGRPIG